MMIPIAELGDVKVGDQVEMIVKSITDGMALLAPAEKESPAEEQSPEDQMPSMEDAKKMPLDDLEKALPKALPR